MYMEFFPTEPDRPQHAPSQRQGRQPQQQTAPGDVWQAQFGKSESGQRKMPLSLFPSLFQLRPHLGHILRQRLQLGLGGELPHLSAQRPKQGLLCRSAGLQALQPVAVGTLQLV